MEIVAIGGQSQDLFQKVRPLEPPVAKQLGVEGTDHDGLVDALVLQGRQLSGAAFDKMHGIFGHGTSGEGRIVEQFLVGGSGDAIEFQPGKPANATPIEVILQGFGGRVETDVAVEFPVARIPRIAKIGTPDLATALGIATKHGETSGGACGMERAAVGGMIGTGQPMLFQHGPSDASVPQHGSDGGRVGALGQPEPRRRFAKGLLIFVNAGADLSAGGLGHFAQKRQQPVGGPAGDDLQMPAVGQ